MVVDREVLIDHAAWIELSCIDIEDGVRCDVRQPPAGEYLSQSLASYVTAVDFADLPGPVVEKAKHQLTYFLGLALAGYPTRSSQDGRKLARVLSPSGGSASIIGETFTAQPLDAAFANCTSVLATGLDDMFVLSTPAIGTHPGSVTQFVGWALGEHQHRSGKDLLTAVVTGYEIAAKLGGLVWAPGAPTMRRQVIPFGPFAATAVAIKLLGLTVEQATRAFGYAANVAMGVSEGPVIGHYYGLVCRNGITAALLGRTHGEVAASVLEGKNGFFRTFFGENPPGLNDVVERLEHARRAGDFDILHTAIKVHPGTGLNVVPLHVLEQLLRRDAITAGQVRSVDLHLPDARGFHTMSQLAGPYANEREATYALPFMFAVVMADGRLNPGRYPQFDDPMLLDLSRRVRIHFEPERPIRYARVTITTTDGQEHTLDGEHHAFELPADRLVWFEEQDGGLLGRDRLAKLEASLAKLEDVHDVADVMALTRRDGCAVEPCRA